ncbi:UNVERIFIED_CONTAM: hypothetical protein Scaly_3040500 [Sesamum calycinum]|uniref:Uncharacterized protein n=1 Tax=Sesamum calycinum TaxID=2727403 RepID=A0AAW2K6D5_9LAMI
MATARLHDMIGKEEEVDDMMVKSDTREGHFEALDKFLTRIRKNLCGGYGSQEGEDKVERAVYYLRGRLSRWKMSEFDIKFVTKKVVKGRAVAEFLAQQPIDDDQEWSLEFPDEHLRSITVQGWRMYFDGASNKAGAGIGVIIVTRISQDVRDQRNRGTRRFDAGPARSKIKPLVLLYSEDPCYEKKQEPVMVATVEEKPWFYDVQKIPSRSGISRSSSDKAIIRKLAAQFILFDGMLYKKIL